MRAMSTAAGLVLAAGLLSSCGDGSGSDETSGGSDGYDRAFLEAFQGGGAEAFVADGSLPDGVEAPADLPADRPGRVGWMLTTVPWPDSEIDEVAEGVQAAVAAEPQVLVDLVDGVGAADAPVTEGLSGSVLVLLGEQAASVRGSLAGVAVPGGLALDPAYLLDTVAAAGSAVDLSSLSGYTTAIEDVVVDGLTAELGPAGAGDPGSRPAAVDAAVTSWVDPGVAALGAVARLPCGADPDAESCAALLRLLSEDLDEAVAQVLLDQAPDAVAPDVVAGVRAAALEG